MLKEFKEFALKGNVVDLAVGIIIGGAFNQIVNSLVNDIVMPPLGLLIKKVDFANLFINLGGNKYATLAAAKAAGAPVIGYGVFLNNVINFTIVALAVFILVRWINRVRNKQHPEPTEKQCAFCFTNIPIKASRCPACTSALNE